MDFGQGKARTTASTVSATISAAGRPGRVMTANQTRDFLSSRASSWSRLRPVARRKPCSAASGASTRGPLRSSRTGERGLGQALDGQGQAAGGGEGGGVGARQAALGEAVGDEAAQVLGGAGLHARRDLLREELEQEVGHGQSAYRWLSWRQR